MKPPRALAVSFELGRPLGAPDEPEFQRRVLRHVLGLFARAQPAAGHILDDFPDPPPGPPADMEGWTCPVNLAPPVDDMGDADKLRDALAEEIGRLQPWYDESLKTGRAIFGISKRQPLEIAEFMVNLLADPKMESPDAELTIGDYTKLLTDDLRMFYTQAAIAQPGRTDDVEVGNWLWGETSFARAVAAICRMCDEADEPSFARLGDLRLIPHHQRHRFE